MMWVALSFLFTFAFSLILINRAVAWGFVDDPGERKVHCTPTPRTGGLAMCLGIFTTWAVCRAAGLGLQTPLPWQTLLAGLGFIAIGALDDRYHFHPRQKFLWMALLAFLSAWPWAFPSGVPSVFPFQFGNVHLHAPRWLAFLSLSLWFLAVPNAVNIEDAINGYMGGFTLLVTGVCASLGVPLGLPIGALAAFLLLNWPRAKHFMGDAGSFGCGFLIAESLLRAGGAQNPLLALALTAPISLDVAMGLVRRVRQGQRLFDADQRTFPHHILERTNRSHFWTSLALLANAGIFAFLAFHSPFWLLGYAMLYLTLLTYLNSPFLFQS